MEQHPGAFEIINDLSFCVFDLETTGGNHDYDKIIEIGLVKIEKMKIIDKADYLINPGIKIPDFIQKLTAISPLDVEDCPAIEDVINEIVQFMGDSILVAHNTSFDVPFFNSVLKRLGKEEMPNKSVCTNLMTKYLMPNLLNSNLPYMSKIFDIKHHRAHRALDDALAAAELLLKYLGVFVSRDIPKVNHLYYPRNRYELDRTHYDRKDGVEAPLEKMDSLKDPALVILKGKGGDILYSLPHTEGGRARKMWQKKMNSCDWCTISFKLYGHLLEVLIQFQDVFRKFKPPVQREIIEHLWKIYLPGQKMPALDVARPTWAEDFVIVQHLVPEQMVILPVLSLQRRNQLIFRYPGHEKKFFQYIRSKGRHLAKNKPNYPKEGVLLSLFTEHYLVNAKKEKSLFVFKKGLATSKPQRLIYLLDRFAAKKSKSCNYPHHYL